MKKIKTRYVILFVILVPVLIICLSRLKTGIAIKKYVKEYYGTDDVKVEHSLLYGSYGIMNGNDNIRYRDGMIMDYQREEDIKAFAEKCNEILVDMSGIVDSYSYILNFFPLDEVHTAYHRLDMHLYNTNDISAEESREFALKTIMEIIKGLNKDYNIKGLNYVYYDKNTSYEADIPVGKEPVTFEIIDNIMEMSVKENYTEWFKNAIEQMDKTK